MVAEAEKVQRSVVELNARVQLAEDEKLKVRLRKKWCDSEMNCFACLGSVVVSKRS